MMTIPIILTVAMLGANTAQDLPAFRPPAAPLVAVDPYFSVWSPSDNLYDAWPMHWTGKINAMTGMIRVDGKTYRFMGPESVFPDAVQQTSLAVLPTQTIYTFAAGAVELTLTFSTPMFADDLTWLSMPVTYITYAARATDGQPHDVTLYFDATAEWAVNKPDQEVVWSHADGPAGLTLLRFGSKDQKVLAKAGDDIRIDWGYFYVALPKELQAISVITGHETARKSFAKDGALPTEDDERQPRAAQDDWPVIACAFSLGKVGAEPSRAHLMLSYDDLFSIEYLQQKLRPWWFKAYGGFDAMIAAAANGYANAMERCAALDAELTADARAVGGAEYAQLIGLGYRHVFASGKIVAGPSGDPLFFHKECFSNGCIATVDVSYPASPFFGLFSPVLLKGMMEPVFEFAKSPAWEWPFAPHDVGTYPKANGQVYGKGKIEGQMPVEECGNMILMAALASRAENSAAYAEKHWDLLTQWADYLKEKGLNPENQLCTDDFAGHLAHNTNLSLKAINALGGYAMMADMLKKPEAETYRATAKEMASQWCSMAADGDHYRLTFDRADSWSMKYNLVWDAIFGMGLFPPEVAAKEVAYYKTVQNEFGLPLDLRKDYTKTDWLVWCATLAEKQEDFEAMIAPVYHFCQKSPSRIPFTDWYDTKTAKCIGFRARPVIGGIFIKFLTQPDLWTKYAGRAAKQ